MKTDSIIFDLDGTLWTSLDACVMAWNKTLEKTSVENFTVTAEMVTGYMGKLLDIIIKEEYNFLPTSKQAEIAIAFAEQEKLHMQQYGGSLYPHVREGLTSLSKTHKLFIVSNCLEGYIENFLQQHKLEQFFIDFECIGNTGKPKSDNIALIISRNALANPVYVGDTMGDYEAAIKNNILFIYAAYGFGKVEGAEYRIDGFGELEGVIKDASN